MLFRSKELFFNTPARKKFLKSDASEVEQVLNIFLPYVLFYPERSFTLTHNGRVLVDLAPAANAVDRTAQALNLEARYLVSGEAAHAEEGISLRVVLGDINIQRPRRDLQYLFVNGRPVQSRTVLFHVNDVYRLVMPDGVHPAFVVFLDIPPVDVDVNIHPAKREVRIRQEARLGGFLRAQIERLLMTRGGAKEIAVREPLFTFPSSTPLSEGLPADKVIFAPAQRSDIPEYRPVKNSPAFVPPSRPQAEEPVFSQFAAHFDQQRENSLKSRLARARFIGTFGNKYHLFEEGESLFAVDQHAAQERILFEKFRRQVASGTVEVQRLLTPVIVALTPQEKLVFERLEEKLKTFGFETTVMDEGAIAVHTSPAIFSDPQQVVQALLADDAPVVHVDTDVLARRACRASVMSGDRMKAEEAVHQLKHLMACDDPFTCPHGRPVFVELKTSFFDRHFLRT